MFAGCTRTPFFEDMKKVVDNGRTFAARCRWTCVTCAWLLWSTERCPSHSSRSLACHSVRRGFSGCLSIVALSDNSRNTIPATVSKPYCDTTLSYQPSTYTIHTVMCDGRWTWVFLSFRGFLLRIAAGIAGRLHMGGAGLALKMCAGGEAFIRPPWPPGAMHPVLL